MSEEQVTLPYFQLPADTGEYLNKLITTYHRLLKPSTSNEFAAKNKELGDRKVVGRGLGYLVQLGIMKRVSRGKYDLDVTGQSLKAALVSGETNTSQREWQAILKKHKLFAMMQEYLQDKAGVGTAVGFGTYVRTKLRKDWGKQFTEDGGRRLCSLFNSIGLIQYDQESGNFSLKEVEPEKVKGTEEKVKLAERNLLRVWVDQTGNTNVAVSEELGPELSRKIVDMVLGAREKKAEKQRSPKR
jgi:hypothetical protein